MKHASLLNVVLAIVLRLFGLGLDFVLALLLFPFSSYLVFSSKDHVTLSHWNPSFFQSVKHSWPVPQQTLHVEVIDHFGFVFFNIIDRFLQRKYI
jgi:hypothetical protein